MDDRTKVTFQIGVIEETYDERLEETFKAVLMEKMELYLDECCNKNVPFSVMDFANHIFYAAGREDAIREILLHEKAKGRTGDAK